MTECAGSGTPADGGQRQDAAESPRDRDARSRDGDEALLAVAFLKLINESRTLRELIAGAAAFFQRQSGCEAIGVRLKDGDDYPYYEVHGFPHEFVVTENSLCIRDPSGGVVRDAGGYPLLECMCGNVICGRFDPAQPFFTANGSFWTNCTTELLATTSEADRQSPTRNRCNGEGYESVALIPLTSGEARLGLLQVNDRRPNRFTAEGIARWERLAGYLAVAVAKFKAEEAQQREAERYRALFANMPNGFALCKMVYEDGVPADFVYLEVNPAFERLTGLSGVVGRAVSEVVPGLRASNPELFEVYGRVASTGRPERFETFVPELGIWFSIAAYSPEAGSFVAVFETITERKRAEQALKELNVELERRIDVRTAELREANRELESFSYSVSHDLRAPLRAINGFTHVLLEDSAESLDEEGKANLQRICAAAARMERLIGDLLSLSRITRAELKRETVNLSEMARSVVGRLQQADPGRSAEVRIAEGVLVVGDPGLLLIAMENLLDNAWKFTSKKPVARIAFDRETVDGVLTCVVRDNGAGFDLQYAGRLFGVFQRLHGETEFPGTGVGLATVARILARHGGRIWADAEPAAGAAFFFTLPRAPR
jgi:signal transduction histidine kinase